MGPQSITTHRHTLTPFWIALAVLVLTLRAQPQTTVSATTIPLILPSAIVFDPQGNLYLAETAHHVIRKIDTTGAITVIAGTGTQGFSGDSGLATSAELDSPQGLAIDTANNLYIADTHNHRIRKLSLNTGIINTIAGSSTPGFGGDSGPATSAHLNLPTVLAIDANGNLYIADTQNHRIREITAAAGIITTIAGTGTQGFSGDNGPATAAAIDSPTGLAVDPTGNIYIADTHNHRIRKINLTTGIITTIAGTATPGFSGDNAPASAASLALPHGLTIDATGNLYLADTANHRIRRIDTITGTITTITGEGTQTFAGDNGLATNASLDTPRTVTLTPTGLPTIADTGNQRIRQIATDKTIHTIAGLGVTVPGALILSAPTIIAYGTGHLTATLATTTPATGSITFLDAYNSSTTTIGTTLLATNSATLDTTTLPAGVHNITATYPGDLIHAAAQSPTISLTITPAPTLTTLTASSPAISPGSPVTLTTHVASTTAGSPTGTVSFLDGATTLLTTNISTTGDATFTTSTLSTGSHTLTSAYQGNTNFSPSTSTPTIIGVGIPDGTTTTADFTLTATGTTTQTIIPGTSASYTFTIQPTGPTPLSSPIALAATGLPNLATASFNPAYLPPGTSNTVTLTITTPQTTARNHTSTPQITALALLLLPLTGITLRLRNPRIKSLAICLLILPLTLCLGCGARINTGLQSDSASPAQTYAITVTGTATSPSGTILQHAATVTLILQPAN